MNTRTPEQLINSIKRVTDDITQDRKNFRIEKNLKKITDPKTGKLVKPIKPKPKLKSFVGTLTVAVLPEVTVVLVVSVPCVVVAFAN